MDELDTKIKQILKKQINTPKSFNYAINTALNKKEENIKKKELKAILISFLGIVIITGGTYGGFIAYEKIWKEVRNLERKGLCAAVYTQLSDIEEEVNGLWTYDREVLKIKD